MKYYTVEQWIMFPSWLRDVGIGVGCALLLLLTLLFAGGGSNFIYIDF